MNWDFLFGFVNALALIGWLALAALPRGPKTMSLVMFAGVAILCLIYGVLFVLLFGKVIDPAPVAGTIGARMAAIAGGSVSRPAGTKVTRSIATFNGDPASAHGGRPNASLPSTLTLVPVGALCGPGCSTCCRVGSPVGVVGCGVVCAPRPAGPAISATPKPMRQARRPSTRLIASATGARSL